MEDKKEYLLMKRESYLYDKEKEEDSKKEIYLEEQARKGLYLLDYDDDTDEGFEEHLKNMKECLKRREEDEKEKIKRFKIKSKQDYETEIKKLYKIYSNNDNDINDDIFYEYHKLYREYKEYKQWIIKQVKQKIIEKVKNKYTNLINEEITERFKQLKKDNKEDYETDIDDYDYYYFDDDIINNTNNTNDD